MPNKTECSHSQQILVLLPLQQMGLLNYGWKSDQKLSTGSYVQVPFRSKELVGIVWGEAEVNIADVKLKTITKLLDIPPLSKQLRNYIERAAEYNFTYLGNILKMVIPVTLVDKSKKQRKAQPISEIQPLPSKTYTLSADQTLAVEYLQSKLAANKYNCTLLEGVTGSGKTEVYFALIREILKEDGAQILILLPEIVLTSQLILRFAEQFGFIPDSWHSGLLPSKKKQLWHRVARGSCRLIIGARSALFLPFHKLKLIIVDEEHEVSYKQEDNVLYQARDMAVLRASIEQSQIILASATTSIETLWNVQLGKFDVVTLSSRFGNAVMPQVKIVDMKSGPKNKWLSSDLKAALKKTLKAKKQSMLFLNRRGYAPLTLCGACGFRFICPNCSSWLVEHRSKARLECHHCGYTKKQVNTCPTCKKDDSFLACGPGVERIEEEVKLLLPEARIVLMTKDTVKNADSAEKIIEEILTGQVDIIIGTQMIAKGHHFPNLALVGVIDADLGLSGGDLRAVERTYQLLHQVSGRAGRTGEKGLVIIQTYYPDNAVLKALAHDNVKEFINLELESRKMAQMPPFAKLAALIIAGMDEDKVKLFAKTLIKAATIHPDVMILGPAPAVISKLRGKYRYRILVKATANINIQKYLRFWFRELKVPSYLHFKIDINPYNFL